MIKIGIHHTSNSYSKGWIEYCESNNIDYKIVNAYSSSIIEDVKDCNVFMWHFQHFNPKDYLIAKSIMAALNEIKIISYPDIRTCWSFDDKLAQKYQLEALGLPLINTYVFFDKNEALEWAKNTSYPKVFKLRGGASGSNVFLVKDENEAKKLIKKSFSIGFRQYNPIKIIRDSINWSDGLVYTTKILVKNLIHLIYPYKIEFVKCRERGYVYFQEYIPEYKYDIRIQFVGNKCYAIKRYLQEGDFRVTRSSDCDFSGVGVSKDVIEFGFSIAKKLKMQTLAIDLIPFRNTFLLTEISYAFEIYKGECEHGYWNENLDWIPGKFNPYGWMVDQLIMHYKKLS